MWLSYQFLLWEQVLAFKKKYANPAYILSCDMDWPYKTNIFRCVFGVWGYIKLVLNELLPFICRARGSVKMVTTVHFLVLLNFLYVSLAHMNSVRHYSLSQKKIRNIIEDYPIKSHC